MMVDVAEHVDIFGGQADLLVRFAQRRRQQRLVGGVALAAGEGHLAAVPVALVMRAPDEQQVPGLVDTRERHQYRGFARFAAEQFRR